MTNKEKELYMKLCKYDKEPKEVILNLLEEIEKIQSELDKKNEIINHIKSKLNEEIKFCENENAHLYDKCSIELKFHKHLLNILEGESE